MMKSVRKIPEAQRWKYRHTPAPAVEDALETPAERVMIDRWVAHQIVDWPQSHCFGCRKPIIIGEKWLELVCDDRRARFHCDCEPVWRAKQEVAARKTPWGRVTGGTLDGAQK
jgi:hypothetical protein